MPRTNESGNRVGWVDGDEDLHPEAPPMRPVQVPDPPLTVNPAGEPKITPTPKESGIQTEGWYGPPQSRRFHYFRKGRSLCSKWLILAPDKDVPWGCALGPANGDCAACKRALEKANPE